MRLLPHLALGLPIVHLYDIVTCMRDCKCGLDWWIDLLTICEPTHTHTSVLKSITVSSRLFLATDFNTGTVAVSLNYTLQIWHITLLFMAWLASDHRSHNILAWSTCKTQLFCCCVCICCTKMCLPHHCYATAMVQTTGNTVPLLCSYLLLRECVYWAVA
jgi:hypothetical protein